jgi:hypothetical protein
MGTMFKAKETSCSSWDGRYPIDLKMTKERGRSQD